MSCNVIVLNLDYTYLNTVSIKKAVKYILNKKVEVVKKSTDFITNAERSFKLHIPLVVRLVKMVRIIYKSKVPFTRKNVFARDCYICQYCGNKNIQLTIDHIIPASRGGKTDWENCVASCRECNNRKGNKTPREAKMRLKKIPTQPTIMEFMIAKMKSLGIDDLLKELQIY